MVVRLYYEEELQKAKANSLDNLKQNTDVPEMVHRSNKGRTNEILAKKAGIGKTNMTYLLAVYRNRPDLFELVFDGTYAIGRAYTKMKAELQIK